MLIVSTCEHKLHEYEFVNPLVRIFPDARIVHYNELVDEYETSEAVIISGTSLMDNDYMKNLKKFEWINKCKAPIIGICAGAQIIAKLHWGELTWGKEIGLIKIEGKAPFPKSFEAYALHKNSISERSNFTVLAKNDKMQAFKIDNKIGILFHPEVRNQSILKSLVPKIDLNPYT